MTSDHIVVDNGIQEKFVPGQIAHSHHHGCEAEKISCKGMEPHGTQRGVQLCFFEQGREVNAECEALSIV